MKQLYRYTTQTAPLAIKTRGADVQKGIKIEVLKRFRLSVKGFQPTFYGLNFMVYTNLLGWFNLK